MKRSLIHIIQRLNRRFNTAYVEEVYQNSYIESARRIEWIKDIPLASPNGGTASFSLLYIILAILRERTVSNILELGVGQSTRLLIQYAKKFHKQLMLIDNDKTWLDRATEGYQELNKVSAELVPMIVDGRKVNWYSCDRPQSKYDFLLIDGPIAYKRSIKYNRLGILNWIPHILQDEFIIVVDDTNRGGEYLLAKRIMDKCREQSIQANTRMVNGGNSQTIIATEKYNKFLYL